MAKKTLSATIDAALYVRIEKLAKDSERKRSWIISKALEEYLMDMEDAQTALERLHDPAASYISSKEARNALGL